MWKSSTINHEPDPVSPPPSPFPWPRGLWPLLMVLLGCAALAVCLGLLGNPARWIPLAGLCLGLSLIVIAASVVSVNRGRDGQTEHFLMPSRAGTIETRSVLLAWLYPIVFGAIGLFLAGVSLGIVIAD